MLPLTARQNQVFLFIREFMEEQGFPPTRAEIAAGLGFRSINAAEDHLKVLARKEAIELLPGTSRGIRLLGDAAETGLPVDPNRPGAPIIGAETSSGSPDGPLENR